MNIPKLTENLNIHQSLPDQPTLTSEELKQEWDKAPNIIKDYLNNILVEEINTRLAEEIDAMKNTISSMEQSILNKTKPVGSLYITEGSENPGTIFSGTWQKIEDAFLLSSGKRKVGSIGGSETQAISIGIPLVPHAHVIPAAGVTKDALLNSNNPNHIKYSGNPSASDNTTEVAFGSSTLGKDGAYVGLTGDLHGTVATSVSGNGNVATSGNFSIMPPHYVVNVWRRIS